LCQSVQEPAPDAAAALAAAAEKPDAAAAAAAAAVQLPVTAETMHVAIPATLWNGEMLAVGMHATAGPVTLSFNDLSVDINACLLQLR
jgi:hypothetical protein